MITLEFELFIQIKRLNLMVKLKRVNDIVAQINCNKLNI